MFSEIRMKNFKLLIVLFALIAFFSARELQGQTITLGQIEPCTGSELIGCDWEGPYTFMYCPEPIDCAGCVIMVEFYAKGLNDECDGNFAIQITSIYLIKKVNNIQSLSCNNCLGNLQNRFNESYAKIFKFYENHIGLTTTTILIQQKSCTKYIGPDLEFNGDMIFKSMTVPIGAFVNFNPTYFPDYELGDPDVSVQVISFVKVCSSDCCCYELTSYWDRTDIQHPILLTLYNGTPCSNVDYECTDGCSGGCEDLLFGWSNSWGMLYGKIGFSTKNFNNDILVSPNPNRGSFSVSFSDKLNGKLTISVANSKGTVLGIYKFDKKDEFFTADLNMDFPNASYVMLIELNGVFIGSQKLIINR